MFMFRRRRIFPLLILFLLGLLIIGGFRGRATRSAYWQGFSDGQAAVQQQAPAAESSGEAAVPPAAGRAIPDGRWGYGPYPYHRGPGFFGLFFFLLFGLFIFKMVRFAAWKAGGHRGRWPRHPHHHGGQDTRSDKERFYDDNPDGPVMEM